MNYLNNVILSMFDMAMIVVMMLAFRDSKRRKDALNGMVCITICGLIIGTIGYFTESPTISLILSTGITFLSTTIIIKESFRERMLTYIFGMIVVYTIQTIVTMSYKLILPQFEYTFRYGLISQITALVVILIIVRFSKIRSIYLYISIRNKFFAFITVNIFAIYFVLLIFWYSDMNGFFQSIVGVLVLALIVLIMNAFVMNKGLKEQKVYDQMAIYETYLPIIENVIDEIRAKQHDYHNHIATLQAIQKRYGDDAEIQSYIQQLSMEDIWIKLMRLDNKIITAFLYSKYQQAQSVGIHIHYHIDCCLIELNYTNYELIEIMGILIDNAMEATQRIHMQDMEVSIGMVNQRLTIQTKNPSEEMTQEVIHEMFSYQYSTKGVPGHGIGLYKLKNLLKKTKGTINVSYDAQQKEVSFIVEMG